MKNKNGSSVVSDLFNGASDEDRTLQVRHRLQQCIDFLDGKTPDMDFRPSAMSEGLDTAEIARRISAARLSH
jgi:hypothetical protein